MTTALAERPLIDRHGRAVTYLRLSVTDRCDLRCRYCLPERPTFLPKARMLTLERLLAIATAFVDLGVTKVRVTGGEPLARRDLPWLLERIAALPGLRELALTTNGTRLAQLAPALKAAGVDRLNISLDTLDPARFARLTRNGDLAVVLAGIDAAAAVGFRRLRLNTVLLNGFNDDELGDLVRHACLIGADIAFIEEMPLGGLGRADADHALDHPAAFARLADEFALVATDFDSGGPARYWSVPGCATRVGFIAPHTRNFCAGCNRVRVTCTGDLHPCLGHDDPVALDPGDPVALVAGIRRALAGKPVGHEFSWHGRGQVMRYMATTGG